MIVTAAHRDQWTSIDYQAGAALLIDKPLEWTSFGVVSKIRWVLSKHYGVKRFKIGHAGTLDPLASGLLILCTGRWTKRITEFQGQEKEYTGTVTLGATRPSYDMETEIDASHDWSHVTEHVMEDLRSDFMGDIMQMPPIYSAKQVDGQRAYKRARQGKEVTLNACPVTISSLDFEEYRLPEVDFRVRCSKGTYIRSLAHDIGQAAQSGAYLSALRRTAIGEHVVADAFSMADFESVMRPADNL